MFKYSATSKERLTTCDVRLQRVFNEVIKYYDCSIICGHRNEVKQNQSVAVGNSQVRWPNSKHNSLPSKAVDALPYPVNWEDLQRMAHFAGFVLGIAQGMGISLKWGADWDKDGQISDHTFRDYPHFELIDDESESTVRHRQRGDDRS